MVKHLITSANTLTIIVMIAMTMSVLILVSSGNKIIIVPPQNNNNNNQSNNPNNDDNSNPNNNARSNNEKLSYWGYQDKKATERIANPTLPPERSYEQTYGVPVNMPTRGISGGFQQIGILHKEGVSSEDVQIGANSDPVILPLYGRPVHTGSNKWSYYTSTDKYNAIKLPISHSGRDCDTEYGCTELYTDDTISLPAYNGDFKVTVYDYDKPRYIPYAY